MTRKQVNQFIKKCWKNNQRPVVFILGSFSYLCIPKIYKFFSKLSFNNQSLSILWLHQKLNFENSSKIIKKMLTQKAKSKVNFNEDDYFQLFVLKNSITWSTYSDVNVALKNYYNLVIVQNFESMTCSLLVRLIESIESKGCIVFLFPEKDSLNDLLTISMDFHQTFDSSFPKKSRFMQRFLSSLQSYHNFIAINNNWSIIFSHENGFTDNVSLNDLETHQSNNEENAKKMSDLHESLLDSQPIGPLINSCRTLEQSKRLIQLMDILLDKTFKNIVAIKGPRGRGKSATLGLAVAGAVALNYSNIFISSNSLENLDTIFKFILIGFETLNFKENVDFEITYSEPNSSGQKYISRILVFRDHQQRIQYISPSAAFKDKLLHHSAELLIIDEACSIPFDIFKSFLGPYLIFLSLTNEGFQASGKSRTIKLLKYLRTESSKFVKNEFNLKSFHELNFNEPILYSTNDFLNKWINQFLCLNINKIEIETWAICPKPEECDLYYINRDSLFSFKPGKEEFLQKLMALYDSTSYNLNPNSLQSMLDHPNHHLFCLLAPIDSESRHNLKISEILCLVHLTINQFSYQLSLSNSNEQNLLQTLSHLCPDFEKTDYELKGGSQILKISTNPNFIEKEYGYGRRAIQLIEDYFKGHFDIDFRNELNVSKNKQENSSSSTLLTLFERKAESLDHIVTSFELNSDSLKLWRKNGFIPICLNHNAELSNDYVLTMIKIFLSEISEDEEIEFENKKKSKLLSNLWLNFREKFISLLSYHFKDMTSSLAVDLLQSSNSMINLTQAQLLNKKELEIFITLYDLKRLEIYSQVRDDYRRITDLLPTIARFYFLGKMGDTVTLSPAQSIIIFGLGLQAKTIDNIALELGLPGTQVLAHFYKAIKKIINFLNKIEEKATEEALGLNEIKYANLYSMKSVSGTLDDELQDAAEVIKKEENENFKKLTLEMKHLAKYKIKGSEDDWNHALKEKRTSLVSIKTISSKKSKIQLEALDKPEKRKQNFKKKHQSLK